MFYKKTLPILPVYALLLFVMAIALYFLPETKLAGTGKIARNTQSEWDSYPMSPIYPDTLLTKEQIEQSEDFYKIDKKQFSFHGDRLSLISQKDEKAPNSYMRYDILIERSKEEKVELDISCYTTKFLLYGPEPIDATHQLRASQVDLDGDVLLFIPTRNEFRLGMFDMTPFATQFDKNFQDIARGADGDGRHFSTPIVNGFFYLTLPEGVEVDAGEDFNVIFVENE